MPLQSLLRLCLPVRFAGAHQTAGRTANASPPFSHSQTQIGPYRCALPADFYAPTGGLAFAFSFINGWFIFRLNRLSNHFNFLTAKVKPPAPQSRVYETPRQAGPLTASHRAF